MSIAETKYNSALKDGYMELDDDDNNKYYDLPGKAGSESTTGEKTTYQFYNRVDATGDDQGNIQVWSKDNNNKTQHIGTKIRAKTAQVVQENASQNVKDWTRKQCEAAGGTNCVQEAEKESNDLMLSEKQNQALNEAAKNEPATDEELVEREKTLTSDVDNAQMRKDYEDIKYPLTLNPEYQDFIQFQMVEYVPRQFKTKGKGTTINPRNTAGLQTVIGNKDPGNKRKSLLQGAGNAIVTGEAGSAGDYSDEKNGERKILATMTLPIPAGIGDQNGVDWGQHQVNQLEAAIAGFTGDVTAGG